MGIRPEGQRLRHHSLARGSELRDPHPAIVRMAAKPHELHGDERTEVSRERRGVHGEDVRKVTHRPRRAAHGDGTEERELGGMDAERTENVVVQPGNSPGGAAGAEAEAIGGHDLRRAAVGLHDRCICNDQRPGKVCVMRAGFARAFSQCE